MQLGREGEGLYLGDWEGPTLADLTAAEHERQAEQRRTELRQAMEARRN